MCRNVIGGARIPSLLTAAQSSSFAVAGISRSPGPQVHISSSQALVWAHVQLASRSSVCNESIILEHSGPVDLAALQGALVEIIRRHQILWTSFHVFDGEPLQVVHPAAEELALPLIDLRSHPEREEEAVRLAAWELQQPFDLTQAPLLRALLVRIGDESYRLCLFFHEIVLDTATARRVLIPELAALYTSFAEGQPSPPPEPAVQYGDYVRWQRQRLQDRHLASGLTYWHQRLAGELPALGLPIDHPRLAMRSFRGAMQPVVLSHALCEPLKALSQRQGGTLFTTLLATFVALLYRYTAQEDILVGTLADAAKPPEAEKLLGCFLNPVPLRIDLSGNPSFEELLRRVQRVVTGALENSDVPFARLVNEFRTGHDLSRHPFFQIMISLKSAPPSVGADWIPVPAALTGGASKLDLSLDLEETPNGLTGSITYNPDLFEPATIARMAEHWLNAILGALADPAQSIAELPLVSETERRRILVEWNATHQPYALACVHKMFEAQVKQSPNAIAVVFENASLDYRELNTRANQLAHYLRARGVGPNVLVGICVERSLEMLVGLLGILKAGGAYVPLDPGYPHERLQFMARDSGLRFLLTSDHLRASLADLNVDMFFLDTDLPILSRQSREDCQSGVTLEDLAYVIYTSGSTGVPKGVEITHRSLANLLISMRAEPSLDARDCLLAVTTISFDIAALELYLPLMVGARIFLVGRETASHGLRLQEALAKSGATLMQATPATWRLLVQTGWQGRENFTILCGGEAVPPGLAEELLRRASSVWNLYGPTETTIWSTRHRLTAASAPACIGRPIANTEVYVLDRNRRPVPVGVIGELYIGGAGVARGYFNRPSLTADRFISHPFQHGPFAGRIYRTGDLVRYLADGNLQWLGRVDNQVKVRGFRIELDEIENALSAHPRVLQALVVVRDDLPGESCLVAYVLSEHGEPPAAEELRRFLGHELPNYMLPSHFVFLDALPLTPNGKVDRNALPAPPHARPASTNEAAPPTDALDCQLAKIWEEVLGIHPVSVRDNFFDLGGHSWLGAKLIYRIEQAFGMKLPLAAVFQAPTPEEMAGIIRRKSMVATLPLLPLRTTGIHPPLFALHGGQGLQFRDLALDLDLDQPFYAIETSYIDMQAADLARIEDLARKCIDAIRQVQPQGPYFLLGFCFGCILALEVTRQLARQGDRVAFLALLHPPDPRFPKCWGGALARIIQLHCKRFLASKARENLAYVCRIGMHVLRSARRTATQHMVPESRRAVEPLKSWDRRDPHTQAAANYFRAVKASSQPAAADQIFLFIAQEDGIIRRAWIEKVWPELVDGRFQLEIAPTDRENFMRAPHVKLLAEPLAACLRSRLAASLH